MTSKYLTLNDIMDELDRISQVLCECEYDTKQDMKARCEECGFDSVYEDMERYSYALFNARTSVDDAYMYLKEGK